MPTDVALRSSRKVRRTVWILIVSIVMVSIGVIVYQPRTSVLVRSDGTKSIELADFLTQNFNPWGKKSDVLIDIPTLAALAANVYEPSNTYDAGCSPNEPGRIRLEGWEQLRGWGYPKACNAALNGLYYEVWGKMDSEGVIFIAVVFRGTVPRLLAHWCSNLRSVESPICDPNSDQYLSIAPLIDDVLSGLYDEWGPDRYIVAVGHSLGGGLAELAGRSSYIDQAFVFDSSPVTGADLAESLQEAFGEGGDTEQFLHNYLQKSGCQFSGNNPAGRSVLTVHRVYEHGEILAYARLMNRWFNGLPVRATQAVEYRINLLHGGAIEQHSMKSLACAMWEASPNTAAPADRKASLSGR